MSALEYTEADLVRAAERAVPLRPNATAEDVATRIAVRWGMTLEELVRGRSRHPTHCEARAQLYRELRAMGWSYPQIGKYVGRDHSTIMAAVKS